jgi:hypothetical protein
LVLQMVLEFVLQMVLELVLERITERSRPAQQISSHRRWSHTKELATSWH